MGERSLVQWGKTINCLKILFQLEKINVIINWIVSLKYYLFYDNKGDDIRKYFIVLASILIMLCLGGIYAFSEYIPLLTTQYKLSTLETQIIFGFMVASFAINFVIAGRLLKKIGPRMSAIIGAILFSGGYLLASISCGKLIILVMGMSIISGSGIGFGYICSITTPIKWFPKKKGLITGLSVAGFGGGAILQSQLVKKFTSAGMPLNRIFLIIGISYGIIILISAFIIKVPEHAGRINAINKYLSFSFFLKDKRFWLLFVVMFSGTFSGLLVIGNLKLIGLSSGVAEFYATFAISMFAVGNSLGRIIWGRIVDLLGGKKTIFTSLLIMTAVVSLLLVLSASNVLFAIVAFAIGIGFGANFVLFAAEISSIYGIDNIDNIYPSVHISYGIAGIISPIIAGKLFDITGSFNLPIIIAISISLIGAIVYATISKPFRNGQFILKKNIQS